MHISIFTRYIAKSLLTFFVGVVGILTLVIFMNHFIRVINMAMTYGTSFTWIISSLLNILPDVFCFSAPMGFQIAVLLTLTNMSEHGELIALRSAGFSFKEIVRPLIFCALGLTVLLFFMGNWWSPKSFKQFMNRRDEASSKITKVSLEPRTFLDLGEWDLYLQDLNPKTEEASLIHLVKKRDSGILSTKVNAASGKVVLSDTAIGLRLKDGQMQRIDANDPTSIVAANFREYTMNISLLKQHTRQPKSGEMTSTHLWRKIKTGSLPGEKVKEYKTEISMRNVLAFSPLILLLVSAPIGFSMGKRTNKGWGMLFSVVIIFAFYLLMTLGISLGEKYAWLSLAGPWLPIAVGLIAAKILWKKRLNI